MNLIQPLLTAIAQCGYQTPTPIQRETIPPVLSGKDVLGCAQTGTDPESCDYHDPGNSCWFPPIGKD